MKAMRLQSFCFCLLASLALHAQASKPGQSVPEPKLPVIDFDACGSPSPRDNSGKPVSYKLQADDALYSSWQDSRTFVRKLVLGTEVTRIGAVNIIQKPDKGVITGELDPSLRPLAVGDQVLGYGLHSDGSVRFWSRGISFTEYFDFIAEKGSCGFSDKAQCRINITEWGVQEWWIQLKLSDGVTGWILGSKQTGDKLSYGPNAGYACRE
jgi:hypothetical protein